MSRSPARKLSREILAAAVLTGTLLVAATASAGPSCMIFVHGKRDGAAGADYNLARDYWISGSRDFIQTATAGFSTPHYVVAYHGDKPYWDAESAGPWPARSWTPWPDFRTVAATAAPSREAGSG
jgi:hypothetical protein